MAVTLVGEIVNSCDSVTGFSAGGLSGDDDFVEGTGALGAKVSNTTTEFYTTSLGATAPYNFSAGGAEEGYHFIMWFGTKTPVDATTGLQIVMGDGTSRGRWNVLGSGFYKGGFITRVINPAANFDVIATGSWTTTGNPAQLSNVTQMGGAFTTITAIMGSFNNCQVDQMTVGLGLRVDGGTVGTPNTFETVRAADEDTAFYGWWSSAVGAVVGKGKLFIGPATGSAVSVFDDTAFAVTFANERVAVGFYEIEMRGAGTDVTWTLGTIAAASAANARWSLTVDSTTNSFSDASGVWTGSDAITLSANTTLTGTTVIGGNTMTQNSATLTDCQFLNPNRTAGQAYLTVNSLNDITGCTFQSSGTGHAINLGTIATTQSVTWNNTDTGYAAQGGTAGNRTILVSVNAGQTLTINVSAGASTPTYHNTGPGTVEVLANTVSVSIDTVETDGTVEDGVQVLVETAASGTYPFEASITTISRSGTTATATTASPHGLDGGDKVVIRGVTNRGQYNGVHTVTSVINPTVFQYTLSSDPGADAAGTLEFSYVFVYGATTSGNITVSGISYVADQAIKGTARKSSSSPYFQPSPIVGTLGSNGFSTTVTMVRDE